MFRLINFSASFFLIALSLNGHAQLFGGQVAAPRATPTPAQTTSALGSARPAATPKPIASLTNSVTILSASSESIDYIGSTLTSTPRHLVKVIGLCPVASRTVNVRLTNVNVSVPCQPLNQGELKNSGSYTYTFQISSANPSEVLRVSAANQTPVQMTLSLKKLLMIQGLSKSGRNLAVSGQCESSLGNVTLNLGSKNVSVACTNNKFGGVISYERALPVVLFVNASAGSAKDTLVVQLTSVAGN